MKHNWIKFVFERNTYVVDLDCIRSFTRAENGRLMFWLPDAKVHIIIHPQSNPEAYQQILDYLEKTTGKSQSGGLRAGLAKPSQESIIQREGSG
jgi:predicted metal-dependent TIM-barrel fold hydrolase